MRSNNKRPIFGHRAFPHILFFFACLTAALLFTPPFLAAQDLPDDPGSSGDFGFGDFGFGDSGSADSGGFGFGGGRSSGLSLNIGGEISAGFSLFYHDFQNAESFKNIRLGDILSAKLKLFAAASSAQAVVNVKLVPVFDGTSPVEIDEAYLRAFFGPVTVEGGFRILSWGRADTFGPLDVINPLDYSDLTKLTDPLSIKISRPLFRAAWTLGSFSKLEGVFVPLFRGHEFAASGRWIPYALTGMYENVAAEIQKKATSYLTSIWMANLTTPGILGLLADRESYVRSKMEEWANSLRPEDLYPDTRTMEYAQAGLRYTTTLGPLDLGFQYFFGCLQRPAVTYSVDDDFLTPEDPLTPKDPTTNPKIKFDAIHINAFYNRYHQVAADFAVVVHGFNIRAEAGANITKDLDGKDGTVENPSIVWSLGFDRDLIWGINVNLQGTGRIRLFQNRLGTNPALECEAGSKLTSSRITGYLSRKFLRDELELKVSGLWGIEDKDFLIMPAVIFSRNDVRAEIAAGFFGGSKKGELGQYRDNSFLKLLLTYKF